MAQREEDNDTERVVRLDPEEAGKNGSANGKNGKPPFPAAGPQTGESAVERSLEDFIARANSSLLDMDGWGVEPQEDKVAEPTPPPKPATPAPAPPPAVAAPTDKTEPVTRLATEPPQIVTRTNWAGIAGAFVVGGVLMFAVAKLTGVFGGGKSSDAPAPPATAAPPPAPPPAP